MKITFTGSKPDSYAYSYSVIGNSGTDRLELELDTIQDGYDLTTLSPQIKVSSGDGNYKDLVVSLDNTVGSDGKIIIICVLRTPLTTYDELIMQLEFIGSVTTDKWQAEPFHLYLKSTLNLDSGDDPTFTEALKSKAEVIYKSRIEELPDIGNAKNIYIVGSSIYMYDSESKIYKCIGKNYEEITSIEVVKGA